MIMENELLTSITDTCKHKMSQIGPRMEVQMYLIEPVFITENNAIFLFIVRLLQLYFN